MCLRNNNGSVGAALMTTLDILRLLAAGKPVGLNKLAIMAETDVGAVQAAIDDLRALDIAVEYREHPAAGSNGSAETVIEPRAGVNIEVCLLEPLDLLNPDVILRSGGGLLEGLTRLTVELDPGSTNETLTREAQSSSIHGVALFAERQSAGQGRLGRPWVSPLARNQYLSIGWQFDAGIAAMQGLSLAIGVALAEQLERVWGCAIQLKWPNDIYADGRKLAGILINVIGQGDGLATAVIGVGLNVKMPEAAASEIDQPWTDLSTVVSAPITRSEVAAVMLSAIFPLLSSYQSVGFSGWRERWSKRDLLYGCPVAVQGRVSLEGIADGVDETGSLMIRTATGRETVLAGDVSLRKVSS